MSRETGVTPSNNDEPIVVRKPHLNIIAKMLDCAAICELFPDKQSSLVYVAIYEAFSCNHPDGHPTPWQVTEEGSGRHGILDASGMVVASFRNIETAEFITNIVNTESIVFKKTNAEPLEPESDED
ncbi:MAG: hypothetical protein JKY54_17410 [Flavobacteriales bacterium]|nr:hypothetical protein [Flavobacteriales bacterium]